MSLSEKILQLIDFFYPLFKRFMPLQTFRYAVCGSSNVVLSFLIFTGMFHLLGRNVVDFGFYAFESYSLALAISCTIGFVIGFLLNKYIVFTASNLRGRIQLFRYFLSFLLNSIINYILLKMLVAKLGIYPVLAQVLVTAVMIVFSYFTQSYFTFKVKEDAMVAE